MVVLEMQNNEHVHLLVPSYFSSDSRLDLILPDFPLHHGTY